MRFCIQAYLQYQWARWFFFQNLFFNDDEIHYKHINVLSISFTLNGGKFWAVRYFSSLLLFVKSQTNEMHGSRKFHRTQLIS